MKEKIKSNLIEVLVIIGVMAILIAVVFVVADPQRRYAEARNNQRQSSVNSILNAFLKYKFDNQGAEPVILADSTFYMIGTGTDATGCSAQPTTAMIDLTGLAGNYLSSIPIDPGLGTAAKTLYYLSRNQNGMILVGACAPEKIDGSTPQISAQK